MNKETVGCYSSKFMAVIIMYWDAWANRGNGRVTGILKTENDMKAVGEIREEWVQNLSGEGKW